MKLSLNDATNHSRETSRAPKTVQPTVNVVKSVLQAYALLPYYLNEELRMMVEVVKIGFYQEEFEVYSEPVFTAILSMENIHKDLVGGWKTTVTFRPMSLMTMGLEPTEERPIVYVKPENRNECLFFPPQLIAERFAQTIKEAVKESARRSVSNLLELSKKTEK